MLILNINPSICKNNLDPCGNNCWLKHDWLLLIFVFVAVVITIYNNTVKFEQFKINLNLCVFYDETTANHADWASGRRTQVNSRIRSVTAVQRLFDGCSSLLTAVELGSPIGHIQYSSLFRSMGGCKLVDSRKDFYEMYVTVHCIM